MTYQRFVSWEKENSKSSDNPTDFKCFERIAICDFEKMKRNRSSSNFMISVFLTGFDEILKKYK